MFIQTGSSVGSNGGDITLQTGPSTEGAPGSIQLVSGGLGRGGDISLRAGQGSDSTGGIIHFQSGSSESSSSGDILIESPHVSSPSSLGPSGNIALSTGDANKSSGSCKDSAAFSLSNDVSDPCLHQPSCFIPITSFTVTISTGSSLQEKSGDIYIESGKSADGQGGRIALQSGRSDEVGGSALISAGDGVGGGGPLMLNGGRDLSSDEENAKAGGSVFIQGGLSTIGDGGAVSVAGGFSEQGVGGKLLIVSGFSNSQASGDVTLATADGSIEGKTASGSLYISTGDSCDESSAAGSVYIESGKSAAGQGGRIALQSGRSDEVGGSALISAGDGVGGGGPLMLNGGRDLSSDEENAKAGGSVFIQGGLSTIGDGGAVSVAGGFSEQGVGGKLLMVSGFSNSQASGDVTLATADGSIEGKTASGSLYISTGDNYDESSAAGSIYIESGKSVLGVGGQVIIRANEAATSDGGDVQMAAGGTHGYGSRGGSITIAAGKGSNESEGDGGDGGTLTVCGGFANGRSKIDAGGDTIFQGEDSMVGNGRFVLVSSGFSSGTSGTTLIESSPSGPSSVSGDVSISTGYSQAGSSGVITLQTGLSKSGAGGSLELQVGDGGGLSNGGDISLVAGQTSAQARQGGSVTITGGEGSSAHHTDGGDGGNIILLGGEAKGESANDNGGSITVRGGTSFAGYGGSLELISGQSTESSSGDICELMIDAFPFAIHVHRSISHQLDLSLYASIFIPAVLASAPSGEKDGSSGSLTLSTGASTGGQGSSGSIVLNTGDVSGGPAGGVRIEVGEAVSRISLSLSTHLNFVTIVYSHLQPEQRETYDVGASIEFKTGHNPNTSSGAFRVETADAGNRGNSGEISLRTGKAKQGNSGSVLFETGPASSGEGGSIELKVGSSDMEHPGGNVRVDAGEAQGLWQNGGSVEISAGTGSHQNSGRGGSVRISGGHAAGMFTRDEMNDGGDIQLVSGSASKGLSGSVLVQTGFSEATSSGEIGVYTVFIHRH